MKQNWKNRTMWTGDNLPILRGMNSESVDLIYLDPPFNSNRDYSAPIGSEAAGAAFKDTWTLEDVDEAWHGEVAEQNPAVYSIIGAAREAHGKGMQSYLCMMAVRLLEMRRVLKDTGSIYLHCDPTASHYLKLLMDAVFGTGRFQSEVVWKRTSSHNRAKRWGPIHDIILFYSAGSKFTWNRVLQPLDENYVERFYRHRDDKGRYRADNMTGPGERDGDTGKPWRGIDPTPRNRHWELPPDRALPDWFVFPQGYADLRARERLDVLDSQGLIYWPHKQGGMPAFKRYLGDRSGSPVQDLIPRHQATFCRCRGECQLPHPEATSTPRPNHPGQQQRGRHDPGPLRRLRHRLCCRRTARPSMGRHRHIQESGRPCAGPHP